MMEFYVPPAVMWFFVGCAWMFVVGIVAVAALVILAGRAKARREREPELEVKDILYVNNRTGSNANDGRTPETALRTLRVAEDVAAVYDRIVLLCDHDEETTVIGENEEE